MPEKRTTWASRLQWKMGTEKARKSFRFFRPNALLMSVGKCKDIISESFFKTLLPSPNRSNGKNFS